MELYIKDRLYIPHMLRETNTFLGYHLKKSILGKIGLTPADIEHYEIKEDVECARTVWSVEKDLAKPLVVDFTEEEKAYIKESLEKLSNFCFTDDFWETVEKIYNSN